MSERLFGRVLLVAPLLLVACQDYNVSRITTSDSYVQGGTGRPVDILWVMDDSATMTEEQDALTSNFRDYADVLIDTSADWQLGVITTDIDGGEGLLVGPILDADTEDLDSAFTDQASVGILGSRDEAPLEALDLATSEPALGEGNQDLFRAEADLQILILTDEDDQSEGTVDSYVSHLEDFKKDTSVTVSLIGGPLPAGCASTTSSAEPAERLHDAVDATGGTFKSICEPDFAAVMKSFAFTTIGLTDTFELSTLPDLETLEVRVDGVLMHQRPTDGWQYDAASNAVVFEGLAVPRPGQSIDLKYFQIFSDG